MSETDLAPPTDEPQNPPRPPKPEDGERPASLARRNLNPPRRRGPRMEEAKPWQFDNSDGSINLGSYALGEALEAVRLAHHLASLRVQELREKDSAETVSLAQVQYLARNLLEAADTAQAANRPDGRFDRMDLSHRRAREAVREALWLYPVPWGADQQTRQAWIGQLADHAAVLVRMAVSLLAERP